MKGSGCYDCKERYIGCHSNCLKYKEYKEYLQEIKDRREKEKFRFSIRRK